MPKKNLMRGMLVLCFAVGFCEPILLRSGTPGDNGSIPEHWRPRQAVTGIRYAGDKACAACHAGIAASHQKTGMSKALRPASECDILGSRPRLMFRNGPYSYEITREGDRSLYRVTDGKESIVTPVLWCFGHGETGQTYVIQHEGSYYESRVSYYPETGKLDFTLGAPRAAASSLIEAVGQIMRPPDARACFSCHSTDAFNASQLRTDRLMPGVGCEACHGPGEKHIAAIRAGDFKSEQIFSPAKMNPDELSQQFCGACHRSWEDVMLMSERGGITNVRFQPYRLAKSECYKDPDDPRISCTACHNPHEDLRRDAAFYDAKCTACHRLGPASKATSVACPKGKSLCVTCHMPKTDLPGAHYKFTDHFIRVARPGDPYPN